VDAIKSEARVDASDRIFIRPLRVRHEAFEYALPIERAADGARAMLTAIDRHRPAIAFPCEMRVAPSDQAWLHPQYGRRTAWIGGAVHAPGIEVEDCWGEAERECIALGGRPHWGKWHTLRAGQLAGLYPNWENFQSVRSRLDPDGLFGSPAIDRLLGTTRDLPILP
ncbi:MAG: D-arabinono-1,4-lactone oxidase, partial [Mycobacteriales bacterium]